MIVTSATIDPERFSRHFGDAPVIEVSGRTYPVENRYRPLATPEEEADDEPPSRGRKTGPAGGRNRKARAGRTSGNGRSAPDTQATDQVQGICAAVDELCAEGTGDILVFLSGEREIRDTADALRRQQRRDLEILPLYARLSAAEQHRVFTRHDRRRVVLATNVAETSLTVPGIHYVVDPGTARISRYSHRAKVQRLPIEPVSQASANQRSGRCGRNADGVCIRLYSEEDYLARPEFTDPEILRTNLASVILRMAALGLGDVSGFPFIDPPDHRQIRDGVHLLFELGALESPTADKAPRLTPLGRRLASLPLDPRLGRMVLEADRNGCLREVIVIAAALTIQDPRERPTDAQQAADAQHARFADPESDFLLPAAVELPARTAAEAVLQPVPQAVPDRVPQLPADPGVAGPVRSAPADLRHDRHFGDRATRRVRPGRPRGPGPDPHQPVGRSAVPPGTAGGHHPGVRRCPGCPVRDLPWFRPVPGVPPGGDGRRTGRDLPVVGTGGRQDRTGVGRGTRPPPGASQLQRTPLGPWPGAVLATESHPLRVPLVPARTVGYARVDPAAAGTVRPARPGGGDWDTTGFFRRNAALVTEVEQLQERLRRRDVWWTTVLFDYDSRLGRCRPGTSTPGGDPAVDPICWTTPGTPAAPSSGCPPRTLPGHLAPGRDGPRLSTGSNPATPRRHRTSISVLNRIPDRGSTGRSPVCGSTADLPDPQPAQGFLAFVPAPDHAAAALDDSTAQGPSPSRRRRLTAATGVVVGRPGTRRIPDHLRITFRVQDARGRPWPAAGPGGAAARIADRLVPPSRAAAGIERSGMRGWDLTEIPRTFEGARDGQVVHGYPALVDAGDSVAVRVLGTPQEQQRSMVAGTRRMLLLELPSPVAAVLAGLDNPAKLALSRSPHGSATALFNDCLGAAVDSLVDGGGGPAWDAAAYATLRDRVRTGLPAATLDVVTVVSRILAVTTRSSRAQNHPTSASCPR